MIINYKVNVLLVTQGSEIYLLFQIGLVICTASLVAELFKRKRLPGLIGAILVGILLGPGLLGVITDLTVINILATLGAILLLFMTGLEFDANAFFKAGRKAFFLTTFGVIASVILGSSIGMALGWTIQSSFLLGVMIAPSGTSIVAATLIAEKRVSSNEGSTILTAAVVDDVECILLLTIALGSWGQGAFSPLNIIWTTLFASVFILGSIYFGNRLMPQLVKKIEGKISDEVFFAILLGFGLIVAYAATLVGLAAITGAFIVGAIIPMKGMAEKMNFRLSLMKDLFVAIFFASIGMAILPYNLLIMLPMILLVLGVAIGARLLGGAIGGKLSKYSGKPLWMMALGLAIRGEISLIIANEGIARGIVGPEFLVIATGVVIGSILIALPVFQKLIKNSISAESEVSPLNK